jgi:hypothetical protein
MTYLYRILSLCKKFFFESGDYVIYRLNSDGEGGETDPEVEEYTEYDEIPRFIRKKLSIYPLINSVYYRIKSHQAVLICIHKNRDVLCYGWIQTWEPFKRKFGWLCKDGIMLGPYWTNPDYREQGYYGRLLKHSIALTKKDSHLIIYTNPENFSSQKGIEKAGFKEVGLYRVNFAFRLLEWHKEIR